jgi:2-polyprenyl-3-methyl-5-hydroxy-6-metoxy-1,4-benzoquinol methylase
MGDGYDVVVCTDCGTGFADGIPSQPDMDRYYSEQSKYTYDHAGGAESTWDLKRFEATADQIVPHLESFDVRILDVGCATGGLLSVFRKRGYRKVMGIDPSPACAAAASRLHGVTVRVGTLAHLGHWVERFDLILMVGVLEHLGDVRAAVNIASRLLSPGGRLYCAVPDVEGLASSANAPYQQFSIEHVNFFSRNSLKRLMAECGMAEVHTWTWTVEWRENVTEPIVSGLYVPKLNPLSLVFDETTGPALGRYMAFSREGDHRIRNIINSLRRSQEPILVWGAGTLARRLLATTKLSEANITAFVDANPNIQGQTLATRPILGPSQITGRNEQILICSVSFEREIAGAIRIQYGLSNRVISLIGENLA